MAALLTRFVGWHVRTYGLWAARHEPYSFAIYPAVAAIVPLIWWWWIGHTAALVLLAIMEGLVVFLWAWMFRRRRRLARERQ
jgi:hypothetical protein